jgi:hypothetical protein
VKGIDNHRTKLKDFTSQITATSTETTPAGKNHNGRKTFLGEITDGLVL